MYFPSSQESLSTKQSRWVTDIDRASRAATDATPRSEPKKSVLISTGRDEKLDKILSSVEVINKKLDLIISKISVPEEVVPYFVTPSHTGRDNKTVIINKRVTVTVEILGRFEGEPLIYPFGGQDSLPTFEEKNVTLSSGEHTLQGRFKKGKNGLYVIQLSEVPQELPVTLTCTFDLD